MNTKKKIYTEYVGFKTTPELKDLFLKSQTIDKEKFTSILIKFCNSFIQKFDNENQHKEKFNNRYKYSYIYEIKFLSYVYVGKHQTNDLNDGYLGSGILVTSFKKDFGHLYEKRILEFVNSKDIYKKENEYIVKYKALYGNACVNVLNTIPEDNERVKEIIKKLKDILYPQVENNEIQEKLKLIDRLLEFNDICNLIQLSDDYIIKAACLAPEAKVAFYTKKNKALILEKLLGEKFPGLYIYNAYIGEGDINENVIAVLDFEDNDNNQFLTIYKEYVDLII